MRSDLGATTPFPRSAKALALNPDAYNAALEREWAGWQKTGLPKIDGTDPRRWDQNGVPRDALARPVPLSFIQFYYADPKSMINSVTGKPLSASARAVHFKKLLQWQLNNRTRVALPRPVAVFDGPADAALKKAALTIAGAAAVAAGAYYLAPTAGGAATVAAPAATGAAPVASAASASSAGVMSSATSLASQAMDVYEMASQIKAASSSGNAPADAIAADPIVTLNAPTPAKKPMNPTLPLALMALALIL